MTWIKLDDTFPNNPKILPLSNQAFRLYIEGLCYANQYLTDGFLAQAVINRLDSQNAVTELLEAGLWLERDNGIQIHDYCEHQTTRKTVEEKREQVRNRVTRYREKGNGDVTTPETETETETETQNNFIAFWNVYPRKVAKKSAEVAFAKAIKHTPFALIISGASKYAKDPNRVDAYTAHPATWLNGHRWLDAPLPEREKTAEEKKVEELRKAKEKEALEREKAREYWAEQEAARARAVPMPETLRSLIKK